jgi:SAM-dependent methyltransferase
VTAGAEPGGAATRAERGGAVTGGGPAAAGGHPPGGGARDALAAAWEREAEAWIRFCRDEDVFAWRFNLPAFLELIPPPGHKTIDVGCGEGRVARLLMDKGHTVEGVDASATLVEAARSGDPPVDATEATAADLPFEDGCADLVVAFMALQSIADLEGAIKEAARVLRRNGRLCFAVVHPMNSVEAAPDYFTEHAYAHIPAGFTFHDVHRPLSQYAAALTKAGFVIEELREPVPGPELLEKRPAATKWTKTPCFLHVRARKL